MQDTHTTLSNELYGYGIDELEVGTSAVYAKTVSEADIVLFAGISGDDNPVHLNQEFAAGTQFGGRIAHGMLSASFISTVVGTRLPGPGCIYMSQTLKFRAPVRVGDTVYARATVTDVLSQKHRVKLHTQCTVGDTVVIDGEAQMYIPPRRKA